MSNKITEQIVKINLQIEELDNIVNIKNPEKYWEKYNALVLKRTELRQKIKHNTHHYTTKGSF